MKQWQVLQTVFPKVITENFEFTNCEETPDSINYWLEEREYMSREDYKKGTALRLYRLQDHPGLSNSWARCIPACSPTQMDRPFHWRNIYLRI